MSSRLTILAPPELRGVTRDLTGDELLLGRADDAGLRITAPEVSRRHAMIRPAAGRAGRAEVVDLDSRAGTMVNGHLITRPQRLSDGDVIRLATVELRYHQERTPLTLQRGWKLGSAAIVSTGAIAAAILSVRALLPAPESENLARFSAVQVTSNRMPLSEYQQRSSTRPIVDGTLGAPQHLSSLPGQLVAFYSQPTADPTDTGTESVPGTSESTPTDNAPSSVPSDGSTAQPSLTPDRSPTVDSSTPDPPASLLPGTSDGGLHGLQRNTRPIVDDALAQAKAAGVIAPGADGISNTLVYIAAAEDGQGHPVTSRVAAQRVVQVLKDAQRTIPSSAPGSRAKHLSEPLGAVVRADVELEGMRKKVVTLSWSMWEGDGATRLQGDWLNENLAYRLRPSTAHDTTSLDIWVPLPKQHGPYIVRTTLSVDGTVVARDETGPFA